MKLPHCASYLLLGLCSAAFVCLAANGAAQTSRTGRDVLAQMRADLDVHHYATAIQRGNAWLESAYGPVGAERMQLWQLLAAAYFPPERDAQHPDSAALPLAAMVRSVPDVRLDPARSWYGLDSLLEAARASQFAVATRPRREYVIAAGEPAEVVVVASRPARFRLTSIALATGEAVTHTVVEVERIAVLPFRASGPAGESFAPGAYRLEVWATDRQSGDSVLLAHRAVATEIARAVEPEIVPPPPAVARRARARRTRTNLVLGGVAFAGATVAIATFGRPDGALRTSFAPDQRAYIVSAAMLGAAFVALRPRAQAPPPRVVVPRTSPALAAAPRILLTLDPVLP